MTGIKINVTVKYINIQKSRYIGQTWGDPMHCVSLVSTVANDGIIQFWQYGVYD